MFIIEELLAPVNDTRPCGEDLAFSHEFDAIAHARTADDPSIEQGAWVTSLKQADWKFVASSCVSLIKTRSKDLRLAVWLAEAGAKTSGFRALGDALLVTAALSERYWDALYPLPDEDGFEQRIGNLCWIAARTPHLVREIALTEGTDSAFSINDFDSARGRAPNEGEGLDLDGARKRTSGSFYQALQVDSAHCLAAIGELERVTDALLGSEGPGFSAAKSALQDVMHFIAPFVRAAGVAETAEMAEVVEVAAAAEMAEMTGMVEMAILANAAAGSAQTAPVAAASHVQGSFASGALQSRAQALAQLRSVAEFFRRTEPHSPVAYLAEKAANWGEQPLHVWLRGVVKDPSVLAQIEEMLGVPASA
ncbi:MAG: type VI secretion system protein TssA [Massilia sp.]|nr:type VI secretion system protein TssA [Massilia sp.]